MLKAFLRTKTKHNFVFNQRRWSGFCLFAKHNLRQSQLGVASIWRDHENCVVDSGAILVTFPLFNTAFQQLSLSH